MLKRTIFYLCSTILVISSVIFFNNNELKAENCCNGGRCTGSASCRACKNCSRCAHCSAGGTCGVCAAPAPRTIYKATKPAHKTKSVYTAPKKVNNSPISKSHNTIIYMVNAKTLNVRSAPSISSKILYTLKHGDQVTLLKVVDVNWYKIQANNVIGYVYQQFIRSK